MATVYDLIPTTDYDNRTIKGNLDISQSQSLNVRSLTAGTYSIGSDIVILGDATAGNIFLNLPTIASTPRQFYLVKKTNLTNTVRVSAAGGNTINGSASFDLTSNISIEIINPGSGTDWTILSNIIATSAMDSGIGTRELINATGAAQNPSLAVTNTEVNIISTATGTLANGSLGQSKKILITGITAGTYTLTVTTFLNGSTILFDTVGQSINLIWTANGWILNGGSGATVL